MSKTLLGKDLHKKEASFHDAWAQEADANTDAFNFQRQFEAPTALEACYILDKLGSLAEKKILDVGCGLGEAALYFASHGAQVCASDISSCMAGRLSRIASELNLNISVKVSAAEYLPYQDLSFDVVYAANLVHHVSDKEAFYKEIRRVLKEDGLFVSWDPLGYNPLIWIYRLIAFKVRTKDESPLYRKELKSLRSIFLQVESRTFWLLTQVLFLKYFFINWHNPNQIRYWKLIYDETEETLGWWMVLKRLDEICHNIPIIRWLAWNIVIISKR